VNLLVYVVLAAVGTICVLNLILLLGVIRRLREHSELISKGSAGHTEGDAILRSGETVSEFSAVGIDGDTISLEKIDDLTLVGFFSPTCPPCKEQIPHFRSYAERLPFGRAMAVAVIGGEGEEAMTMAESLNDVARVIVEPLAGPVSAAFRVSSVPAVALVEPSGKVLQSGRGVTALPNFAIA